jgi:HSP20 family molecular chaperone IbpA
MAVMKAVGADHRPPAGAHVRDDGREYVIELDVSDFLESELVVEAVGPRVTVVGDQTVDSGDDAAALRLHERLEESFRLPDDADADLLKVVYEHGTLELRVPRIPLEPRRVPIEHRPPYATNPDAEPI